MTDYNERVTELSDEKERVQAIRRELSKAYDSMHDAKIVMLNDDFWDDYATSNISQAMLDVDTVYAQLGDYLDDLMIEIRRA